MADPHAPEASSTVSHWDEVYRTRADDQFSWRQDDAPTSRRLIGPAIRDGRVVDVGAGTSRLVDGLLADGWSHVTLLDVSAEALRRTRARVDADRAEDVETVAGDVLTWRPPAPYDVWHDRAVLHFLTDPDDRATYARLAVATVRPGGLLVLGGFAPDGPTHCSGLPVARHTAEELAEELAGGFDLERAESETHRTPWGTEQEFTWVRLRQR